MCLLDHDDDLFGNHSDSSTKPLMDDPDYVPMFGPGSPGSTSTGSTSPDSPPDPRASLRRHLVSRPAQHPSPRLSTFFKPDAPPLPPPNHSGPRSFPTPPPTPPGSSPTLPLPRPGYDCMYENNLPSNKTLPRSFSRPESGDNPWLPQQHTMPRQPKKVWFPQAGDKKPELTPQQQNRSNDSLAKAQQPQQQDSHSQGAALHIPQQVKKKPPLKPKPKVGQGLTPNKPTEDSASRSRAPPGELQQQQTPPGGTTADKDLRTPNGLVYPQPPTKPSDNEGPGATGSKLMEYCDELLAELETMAKTWK